MQGCRKIYRRRDPCTTWRVLPLFWSSEIAGIIVGIISRVSSGWCHFYRTRRLPHWYKEQIYCQSEGINEQSSCHRRREEDEMRSPPQKYEEFVTLYQASHWRLPPTAAQSQHIPHKPVPKLIIPYQLQPQITVVPQLTVPSMIVNQSHCSSINSIPYPFISDM